MSIKVFVKDSNKRPARNIDVFIQWSSGTSRGRTDGNGIFDTGVNSSSTVKYVQVDGRNEPYTDLFVQGDHVFQSQLSRSVS